MPKRTGTQLRFQLEGLACQAGCGNRNRSLCFHGVFMVSPWYVHSLRVVLGIDCSLMHFHFRFRFRLHFYISIEFLDPART